MRLLDSSLGSYGSNNMKSPAGNGNGGVSALVALSQESHKFNKASQFSEKSNSGKHKTSNKNLLQ